MSSAWHLSSAVPAPILREDPAGGRVTAPERLLLRGDKKMSTAPPSPPQRRPRLDEADHPDDVPLAPVPALVLHHGGKGLAERAHVEAQGLRQLVVELCEGEGTAGAARCSVGAQGGVTVGGRKRPCRSGVFPLGSSVRACRAAPLPNEAGLPPAGRERRLHIVDARRADDNHGLGVEVHIHLEHACAREAPAQDRPLGGQTQAVGSQAGELFATGQRCEEAPPRRTNRASQALLHRRDASLALHVHHELQGDLILARGLGARVRRGVRKTGWQSVLLDSCM